MSLWIDVKYVNLISRNLERFIQAEQYLWVARCPYCGDSKKNKYKRRFYIYEKSDVLKTYCHNCGHSGNLRGLLKFLDSNVYRDYVKEIYFEENPKKKIKCEKITNKESEVKNAKKISALSPFHPAVKFLKQRKIPEKFFHILYHVDNYYQWANSYEPGKYELKNDHPRIIIPFYDEEGKWFKSMARSYNGEEPKYRGLTINKDYPSFFGLERLDKDKTIYVTEGPIDSLFVDNAIAVGSSSLTKGLEYFKGKDLVLIFDNEPRNKEIVTLMQGAIDKGYGLVIWPKNFEYKDINEAIQSGLTSSEISCIIKQNTFSNLMLKMEFDEWRKCDINKSEFKRVKETT